MPGRCYLIGVIASYPFVSSDSFLHPVLSVAGWIGTHCEFSVSVSELILFCVGRFSPSGIYRKPFCQNLSFPCLILVDSGFVLDPGPLAARLLVQTLAGTFVRP